MKTNFKKALAFIAILAFSLNLQAATSNNGSDTTKMAKKKMDKMEKGKMKMDKEKMKMDDKKGQEKMKMDDKMSKAKKKMAKDSSKMKM